MPPKENTLIEILFSKTAKTIYISILLGLAWGRFEYNMGQSADKIAKEMGQKIDSIARRFDAYNKKVDEHILSDGFEKKAILTELNRFKDEITDFRDQAKDFFKNEYIRPDEVRPKEERRRR